MSTELLTFPKTIVHGEALDFSIDLPLDYAVAGEGEEQESPLTDGSFFTAAFKRERKEDVVAVIRFDTRYPSAPRLTMGEFVIAESKLTLAFQASAERVRQIAPEVYIADILHHRPRPEDVGDDVRRVALLTLEILGGTD